MDLAPPPKPVKVSRRVLVVDDNVDSAETMAEILKLWGHDVRTAHDGPGALETARAYRPDAVLLDLGLPVMDRSEEHTSALQSRIPISYAVFCLRSEERRVGKECGYQCRSRWSPYH